MSPSPNRLSPPETSAFAGHRIDRSRPLTFRLNGREIGGYRGDTVLSALRAAGIDRIGTVDGIPLALDARLGLAVRRASAAENPAHALPVDRTPAGDGMEFTTFGAKARRRPFGWFQRMAGGANPSLDLDCDAGSPVPAPLTALEPRRRDAPDVVVVGGGIAGLSAAARTIEFGMSVLLVERRPWLGGDAILFGQTAGEENPADTIARLTKTLEEAPGATVMTHAEALSLAGGELLVHQVDIESEWPTPRLLAFTPSRIVIATGTTSRLPLFPGNRLPGVMDLAESWHLATAYGVWPGSPTMISTTTNAGYRLALLAHDAGAPVDRLVDTRLAPQSRFAEFAKAYGVKSSSGLRVHSAVHNDRADLLTIKTELSWEGGTGDFAPHTAKSLIVTGGWMPRLSLWQQAGGKVRAGAHGDIEAGEAPEGVAVAGSCAGYLANSAVGQSGAVAVDTLLGRSARAPADSVIDPDFESPDDPLPVSSGARERMPARAYLATGGTLVTVPPAASGKRKRFRPAARRGPPPHESATRALSLADIAALTALGTIPPEEFAATAAERAITPQKFAMPVEAEARPRGPQAVSREMPSYLEGRFGPGARLMDLTAAHGTRFEVGNLVFANSDSRDPANALGVVVRSDESGMTVLVRAESAMPGHFVSVMGPRGHTEAHLAEQPGTGS